jgi:hypothetical protein
MTHRTTQLMQIALLIAGLITLVNGDELITAGLMLMIVSLEILKSDICDADMQN